ncbi:acyltransferase domain-containing protein, partial [Micromonospora schwarzwaldensis]
MQTRTAGWPDPSRPLVAGVSSFGMGGANCHVVVSEVADGEAGDSVRLDGPVGSAPWALSLSAKTARALGEQAVRLRAFVSEQPEIPVRDVAWTLATARSVFAHRAVVVAGDVDGLLTGLQNLAGLQDPAGVRDPAGLRDVDASPVVRGVAAGVGGAAGPVFVFPGQGAQWVGMGLALWDAEPVFAEAMARCAQALAPLVGWSLREVLADPVLLGRVDVVQPVSWAVMVS